MNKSLFCEYKINFLLYEFLTKVNPYEWSLLVDPGIAFCSIAVCDGWGRRTRSEETNNVQSRSSDEFDNGKQSNQSNDGKPAIPLRHRLSEFGQAGPKSALNHTQGEDNVESSVSDLLLHASESEGKLTMDFMAVS